MSATTVLHTLADWLDAQPNRQSDLYAIRGWARRLGLTGDWLGILPEPGKAHHAEYANRLRNLAGGGR